MDHRFALLLTCFWLSGFAALLYQTVWTRELSFVFGTSELAVAAVLAAYMGGLALGAAAAARIAHRLRRPVLAYGALELAIAMSALTVPVAIRAVNGLYVAWLGGGEQLTASGVGPAALFQLAAAFAVLLLPTAFMGATLPLLARHAVRREQQIGLRIGVLYSVNTAGAIVGAVVAAFWLIPELGLRLTVWVGAAMNGAVFALAALLARGAPLAPEAAPGRVAAAPGTAWILPAIALSGAVSFAYEVLWTRLLGHIVGASLQAFATMLASFLLGIALGSAIAARLATSRARAAHGFAVSQLGIAVCSYVAFALAEWLPDLGRRLGAGHDAPLAGAALAVVALLPITSCIGATFPFAVRAIARGPEDSAGATARVYAWNTLGAIAGALGAGFVLLPRLGFEGTLGLGVAANLGLAAAAAWLAAPRRPRLAALAAALGLVLLLAPARPPWSLLRHSPLGYSAKRGELVFAAVGRSSSVILVALEPYFSLFTNGLPEAEIERRGRLFSPSIAHWLGALPTLLRPEAREMLVVGLGGGAALEAVPSSIEKIDVIELEPEVVAANRAVSAVRARDPLADPRVNLLIGDARGALQLTAKRYDAIVSQPSHPWTAGASHLYTREFFSLARARLEPDGVFVQWIGPAFVDEALLRSLVATLVEVFGHVEVYAPRRMMLLFAASPTPIDGLGGAARALRAAPDELARFGLHGVEDFASGLLLDESGARALAQGARPNTDDANRLASRASRLGADALDAASLSALFAPLDPLRAKRDGLDRGALLRSLVRIDDVQRARSLAMAESGTERERALGWIELANQRPRSAARHFEAVRAQLPDDPDSLLGLVASRRTDLAEAPVAEIPEARLEAPVAALIEGWRRARLGDWAGVVALDAELARLAPPHALAREAALLRAESRLGLGDAESAAVAASILEPLLVSAWLPSDELLHARALADAGRPEAAWAALGRIASRAPRNERGRDLARRALALADGLPEDPSGGVRARLERRAQARPPG